MPFLFAFDAGVAEIAGAGMGAEALLGTGAALGAGEALGATGAFDMGLGGIGEAMGGLGAAGEALGAMAPTTGAGITQAAMGPATQGIVAGGEGAGAAGINSQMVNAVDQAAGAAANSGITQAAGSAVPEAASHGFSQAELEAMQRGREVAQASSAAPPVEVTAGQGLKGSMMNAPLSTPSTSEGLKMGSSPGTGINVSGLTPEQMAGPSQYTMSQGLNYSSPLSAASTTPPPPSNPFLDGVNGVMDWAKNNKFQAAGIAYMGAKKLGLLDDNAATAANRVPDKGIGYNISPDFKGRYANPEDYQYTPKRYNYAEGGIMQTDGVPAYARGGDLSSTLDQYTQMMDQRAGQSAPAPARGPLAGGLGHDTGIYYDLDPDTRYQDALTAAQIRMAKVGKRANMQIPGMKRPTPMGQINLAPPGVKGAAPGSSLDPENAAQGGIMHSSLGGYAAGGNPRLLKGPGDGMSDNIPATINGRQPARLADGEFVVPADVVSHLGNGSTDAGAKILHHMMTQVRKERTGNPKQGKQINPNKFMPK